MRRKDVMFNPEPYSLYFHVPFCVKRCGYCDFNTYAGKDSLIPLYVDALQEEIKCITSASSQKINVHSVYFGGGTPSLVTVDQYTRLFQVITEKFSLTSNAEISIEANPGTINGVYLSGLRNLGINRLSLGVQSMNDDELKILGRIHNRAEILEAVKSASVAGFNNLNLDLIYGIPGQSIHDWQRNLKQAIQFGPEHLSLYALSIEKKTPFGSMVEHGKMNSPDADLAADMYEWAGDYLEKNGYLQYEISNWSREGFECIHNLQYWRNRPYLGVGAGAHGCANNRRTANVLRIQDYINHMKERSCVDGKDFPSTPATKHVTFISEKVNMQETLMLAFRLTREGVNALDYYNRFGRRIEDDFDQEVNELLDLGLIEKSGDSFRMTKRGRLLGNQVFLKFVD